MWVPKIRSWALTGAFAVRSWWPRRTRAAHQELNRCASNHHSSRSEALVHPAIAHGPRATRSTCSSRRRRPTRANGSRARSSVVSPTPKLPRNGSMQQCRHRTGANAKGLFRTPRPHFRHPQATTAFPAPTGVWEEPRRLLHTLVPLRRGKTGLSRRNLPFTERITECEGVRPPYRLQQTRRQAGPRKSCSDGHDRVSGTHRV
jgi:hypothetical protein